MTQPSRHDCCDKQSFVRLTPDSDPLTDPGSAEGVEFTIGTCANCGRYLVHCWVGGGVSQGCEVVDPAFVERLRTASDAERKVLLAAWWDAIG